MKYEKVIKFKLSDMLELALKELAVVKETTKHEFSCDALYEASEKFAKKNNLPVSIFHYNNFPRHVTQLWKGFAFGTVQVNLNFSSPKFQEFYQKDDEGYKTIPTRKSQQARALFLTFGAMLLRENPKQDNCTYSFDQ